MEDKNLMQTAKYFFNKNVVITDPNKLGEALYEICKEFGLGYSGVSKLAISYARQGLNIDEIINKVKIDLTSIQNGI